MVIFFWFFFCVVIFNIDNLDEFIGSKKVVEFGLIRIFWLIFIVNIICSIINCLSVWVRCFI